MSQIKQTSSDVNLYYAWSNSIRTKLSDRIEFFSPESKTKRSPNQPSPSEVLIMYLPFLGAQEWQKKRYINFYLSQGFDVLSIDSHFSDFLWPPNATKLCRHILDTMHQHCEEYKHIIAHCISVGSYTMSTLRKFTHETENQTIMRRLKGVVYDSFVLGSGQGGIMRKDAIGEDQSVSAIDRMINSQAAAVSGNAVVQFALRAVGKLYFSMTKSHTVECYEKLFEFNANHPAPIPTLMLTSSEDPWCDGEVAKELVATWKESSNIPVKMRTWDGSFHACLLRYHQEDYIDELKSFLENALVQNPDDSNRNVSSRV